MSGTDILYGNVRLRNVQTESFEQNVIYDESGTDLLYHQFRIRVNAIVTLSANTGEIGAVVPGSTATEMQGNLHAAMMHPRQDFKFYVDDEVLLESSHHSKDPYRDVNNGPKPQRCAITHIAGHKMFRISWEVEIAVVLCGEGRTDYYTEDGQPIIAPMTASPVLNNRWTLSEEKDQDFATSRTWTGKLRVAHIDYNPNWVRHLVVPQKAKGYRRMRMRFLASANGLELNYEITDRQEYEAPPFPATSWSGQYREGAGPGGKIGSASVSVTLSGPPNGAKADLLSRAAEICRDRIRYGKSKDTALGEPILVETTIVDHIGVNRVTVEAHFKRFGNKDEPTGSAVRLYLGAVVARMGTPMELKGYDPKKFPSPSPYDGTTPVSAYIMYLQNPCGSVFGMPYARPGKPEKPEPDPDPDDPPSQYNNQPYPLPDPQEDTQTSQEQNKAPYTWVELSNRYVINHGVIQVPLFYKSVDLLHKENQDASSLMIQVHPKTCRRIQHMSAERIGDWPTLPSPEATPDPNGIPERILREDLLVHGRELMTDKNTYMHRVEMEYVYGMARAPNANELLRSGSDPADTTTPEESTFPLATRQGEVIE